MKYMAINVISLWLCEFYLMYNKPFSRLSELNVEVK